MLAQQPVKSWTVLKLAVVGIVLTMDIFYFIYIGAPVNIENSMFKLRFLFHFCIGVNASEMSRSSVKIPFW